jgi:peptide/nickel transport system permease protein
VIRYIIFRLFAAIPTLLLISALIFFIIQLPPGDYFETYIAELQAQGETVDPNKIAFLKHEYGFDKPMIEQYGLWVVGMLHGDFGYSFEYEMPVTQVIGSRLYLTVLISTVTIIFTWLVAFPIGIYSAVRQYSWGDYGLTFVGLLGLATPNFLLALILM